MSKKLSLFLLLILSGLTFGLLKTSEVQAEDSREIDFVLHKVIYDFDETIEEIANYDGTSDMHYEDFERQNDVTFEVYDVTNAYYQLYAELGSQDTVQQILAEEGPGDREAIMDGVTGYDSKYGANGIVRFEGLAFEEKAIEGKEVRPKAYLFHESKRPTGLRQQTNNLVVILSKDFSPGPIHLYPKNELLEEVPFDKEIVNEEASYEVGEDIPFQITTKVPEFPLDLTYFVIRDVAMEGLQFIDESFSLTINGMEQENLYTMKERANGFFLEFNLENLVEFAGEEMLITYTMFFKEDAVPDRGYRNFGELEYDNNILTDWEEVRTGGFRFLKVDRMNSENTLADAHFVVKDSNDRYLHVLENSFEWHADRDTATIVESAEDGTFEVTGLKYGQYSLEEVKAPEGYILSDTPIDFEVEANTYNPGAVMNIINEPRIRLPITGGEVPPAPETPERPVLKLPFTGFYDNIWLSILGLMFITTALFIQYKVVKKEEE